MADFSMEKLLRLISKVGCDEIYVTVGDSITVRNQGHIARLETKLVTAEDTHRLMKQITPECYRREREADGSVEFGCVDGNGFPFHVSLFKDLDTVRMVVRQIKK